MEVSDVIFQAMREARSCVAFQGSPERQSECPVQYVIDGINKCCCKVDTDRIIKSIATHGYELRKIRDDLMAVPGTII